MSFPQSTDLTTNPPAKTVVLVHGVWCRAFMLYYLAWQLKRQGFVCYCLSYASVFGCFEANAERLREKIARLPVESLQLVAHSYGGLELLHMLDVQDMPKVKRLVLLGSPVQGAALARVVQNGHIRRRLLGFAAERLARGLAAETIQRAASMRPIGIISGTRNRTLLGLLFGRIERGDGLVAEGETHIPGAVETTLPVSHAHMLLSSSVAALVSRFLDFGEFDR